MSNPARAPRELTQAQLELSVAPDSYLPEGFADYARKHKKIEAVQSALRSLDMGLAPTIVLPRQHTVAASVHQRSGPSFALAKTGIPVPRTRSAIAKQVVNRMFGKLPMSGPFSQETVGKAMGARVHVDAGVEGALGRIATAYPKVGKVPSGPVTRAEAEVAVSRCGISMKEMPAAALRPFPLTPRQEEEQGVFVNPNSDNGFPVLGKWSTPGAAKMAMGLALTIRSELERAPDVEAWVRRAELERPWLVALRGKAKADYYSQEKVVEGRMRFYNAFPRQVMLNMQVATQVLEMNSKHIGWGDSHSGIGMTLTHNGARDLVQQLDHQYQTKCHAYVHVGDDSWVVLSRGHEMCMFALDMSNFDLTQHSTVTKEVHLAVREELRRIDPIAADLWFAYARERLVVTSGSIVRRWKHGGPSGMPLQSKVNDMLMDVMIRRLLDKLAGRIDEYSVRWGAEEVAQEMGFTVRLEQYKSYWAQGMLEALEVHPFLFVGYYFHVRGGEVRVHCDVPRTMSQLPFPALKWVKTPGELQVTEAMRLGSIALNLGMPSTELVPAFAEYRMAVIELLEEVIGKFGDRNDPKLRWAVMANPLLESPEPSLSGLLAAIQRGPAALWATDKQHLHEMPPTEEPIAWEDAVLLEERQEEVSFGFVRRRPDVDRSVRRLPIATGRVPTHPATLRNEGRPPPTVVWGPPRPPQVRMDTTVPRRHRAARLRGETLFEEPEEQAEFDAWVDDVWANADDDYDFGPERDDDFNDF